jgi:hypothetical protein
MRTSLTEIQQTEKFLLGEMNPGDALVFEARMLSKPLLKMNVFFQKKVHAVLRAYHRKKLKEEAEAVHQQFFSDPAKKDFREMIFHCFKK